MTLRDTTQAAIKMHTNTTITACLCVAFLFAGAKALRLWNGAGSGDEVRLTWLYISTTPVIEMALPINRVKLQLPGAV